MKRLYLHTPVDDSALSTRIKKWMVKGDVERAKIAASVAFFSTLGGVFIVRFSASCSTTGKGH